MNQTAKAKTRAKNQAETPAETADVSRLTDIPASDFAESGTNSKVLRQVIVGYLANQQRSTAQTKTRGKVSGGGRKPWRQKGTGRARTGSIRNPIWRGGGIIFGPSTDKNHSHILPAKWRRQSLASALLLKAKAGKLKMLKLNSPLTKTKEVKIRLPELYGLRRVLLVVPDAKFKTPFKNLPNIHPIMNSRVNALDILSAHHVVFINDTYKLIKDRI